MKITAIEDNPDGSLQVVIDDLSPDETALLIEEGFKSLLVKLTDEMLAKSKVPAILKGDGK